MEVFSFRKLKCSFKAFRAAVVSSESVKAEGAGTSGLPVQGACVQSLVRELSFACHN